ncbi:MAG: hypothetical protein RR350_06460 [Oscillibacter sp.]
MALFGKRETVFSEKNQARYELCKTALENAGIQLMESGSYETEAPISGCGAKLDARDFGPGGKVDRRTYYLAVRPEDAAEARTLLETV